MLGQKFTPPAVGIITKIRETDAFLQNNPKYKNVIKESHPEVCFARLKGSAILSKKTEIDGIEERIGLISKYISDLCSNKLAVLTKKYKCKMDDIVDAICLAVTANLAEQGYFEVIPECPKMDETGIMIMHDNEAWKNEFIS